ncbi:AbrB/MazE/SpoVT family DNA-binding domain-containing protein [Vibrio sp. Makdt]|uniref:AbrB/MazE/SpoVT family DNA-binding domain-containing protein n=1 Tax=Vibrio sp. Makdt TaxID=2998828 RepID=UPI0022CD4E6E|nr:AbrB/MazE/SpoVT family DNA-binding domain-containing protein [Vibrio sp. Makdt]MDA0152308.1 AbrB/MazE/SpoVT family DNA-binding domain-containing protein [Vibrio sp. Makdt]
MSESNKEFLNIGKWGNNLAIRFGKEFCLRYNITKGNTVEIEHMADGFFVRPVTHKPQPKVSLLDIKYDEEVSIDPQNIETIHLVNDSNHGYVLRISTKVTKITVKTDQLIELESSLTQYHQLPDTATIMICLSQLLESKKQAKKASEDYTKILNLWEQCGIVWRKDTNPLKSPDFLNRMSMLRSQMDLL